MTNSPNIQNFEFLILNFEFNNIPPPPLKGTPPILRGEFSYAAQNFAPNIGEMSAGQRGIIIPIPQAIVAVISAIMLQETAVTAEF